MLRLPVLSILGKHFIRKSVFLMKKERFGAAGVFGGLGQTYFACFKTLQLSCMISMVVVNGQNIQFCGSEMGIAGYTHL